ncbi:sensor histidine kinase [uncultured Variovorax sp.]|uniref:sensor histidine kinase n=1 Tax=uncultured Variovorax sp. TaxID=114708 RepID=UPI0025DDE518|nr:sensor histidine kinase [uncultured Variovorax sp.]
MAISFPFAAWLIAIRGRVAAAFILLACLALASHAQPQPQPQPLTLDARSSLVERSFIGHMQAFLDESGQLTRDQVDSPAYEQRFSTVEGTFNGGYARGAWWVKFQVRASPEQVARPLENGWWLRLNAPYADYIDVWWHGADGTLEHRSLGGMRAGSKRELPWSIPTVRLPEWRDTEPRWIWVRLAGDRTLSLVGGVSPLREQAEVQQELNFVDAGVTGMALLMAVVSLMMGIALPDRRFIAYAGYLVTLGLLFASSEGLPASFWLRDSPVAAVRLHNFAVCLHTAAAFAFARVLLDMQRQFPRMNRLFQVMTLACLAACAAAMGGWYGRVAQPLNLAWVLFAACIVPMCVLALRRNMQAWPGLVGYAVYLMMGSVHFAKNLQWLPYTLAAQASYAIGSILHIMAFFFALGWRVRQRERRALALSLRHRARLAQRVNERTRDLRQEIEQHHRTHDQLALALREQRGLLAMVSHEFRTPLGTIGGAAQILTDDRLGLAREEVKKEADKIGRTVLRMRDLVDTLLADEWLDASSGNVHPVPIDLAVFLREKIEEHNEAGGGARIALQLDASALPALADEMLLHIAMDNLLSNAIKYAPSDSPIRVRAGMRPRPPEDLPQRTAGPCVCIQVSDKGPGFGSADLPHVFERFYRSAGTRRIPGIGLGLHMVHRIAAVHGGSVAAANGPGGGAVLTLTLPALASDASTATAGHQPGTSAAGPGGIR